MNRLFKHVGFAAVIALLVMTPASIFASSHMDAPLIVRDPSANTTDVYAFVDQESNGQKSLVVALGVYPHQEPGIGPNKYNFDDNVRYEIHVALGRDIAAGRATYTYRFQFKTNFKNVNTILQSYLGVIQNIGDANQNLTQTYTVTKIDNRTGHARVLGSGIVPPNNQGNATPYYNQGNNGENPARLRRRHGSGTRSLYGPSHHSFERWLRLLLGPARRWLLCRYPIDLRSPQAAQAG